MSWRRVVIAAALALAAGSCASAAKRSAGAPYEMEKQTILAYSGEIRKWRVEIGLTVEPPPEMIPQVVPVPPSKLRLCKQDPDPKTAHCRDVCNVSRAICDNAEDICQIARDMHNDVWATDKCNSAKASCKEASRKCCDCASKETATLSTPAGSGNLCAAE